MRTKQITMRAWGNVAVVLMAATLAACAAAPGMKMDEPAKLTGMEFALLHYLMQHPGELLSHDRLLAALWGKDQDRQLEHLRVYIGRLRRKIEVDPAEPEYVQSAYGEGYRFG